MLQYACEEKGGDEADESADDDFAHAVSHALFETWKLGLVDIELLDEHIEVPALVAEVHTDARGIVDEDECERGGDGE